MSDELHRFYLRWNGQERKGTLKIGDLTYSLSRLPAKLAKRFFDLWYSPGIQLEARDRACDAKRELTAQEIADLREFVRPIGALARDIEDAMR